MDGYIYYRMLIRYWQTGRGVEWVSYMKTKVDSLDQEEGKKILEKEFESCMDAEYVFSKVTDINDREMTIPVILLKGHLKNKDKYLDVTMQSKWSAINGDMNKHEAWMFLSIDFRNVSIMRFKFNLFDANVRKWIEALILVNGNAVLCDRNEKTDFDVGLSNIPLDIPIAQMTLTAFFLVQKRSSAAG